MEKSRADSALFWTVAAGVLALDIVTKVIAVAMLVPQRVPREVFGDAVRLTLVYNPGAAFGLYLGPYSRWIFMILTVAALGLLWHLYRTSRPGDRLRLVAIALVGAGAVGNLIDRVRSSMGVVDFIDIGIGAWRWPTFNVADMAVSTGAFLLAWVLWGEDRQMARADASPRPMRQHAEP